MRDKRAVLLPTNPWPLAATLVVFAVGFVVVAAGQWRLGTIIMAASLLLAAAARMTLPRHVSGLLVLRRRVIDVLILGGLGTSILVFALLVPPGS